MILVDTSAWVEYDRATGSAVDQKLTELIRAGGAEVAVTEPVLMEVLAGAADEHSSNRLRRLLTSFRWVPVDAIADFEGAAKIYRICRAAGISPRGLIDCLVANVAVRTGHPVLAADRDFASIARVVPLRLAAT
jgi:predicted nucleic acid-binding protein